MLRGDIAAPQEWVMRLPAVDAVVQMACDFDSPMAAIERRLLDTLLPVLASRHGRPRFIYTGGCWLFGATGDAVATEGSPMTPLPAFAWMVPHAQRVLASPEVHGVVVHPGMVYGDGGGGVFRRFAREAVGRPAIRVVGSADVRWPLVHCDDLAALYALALERAPAGESYLGVAVDGMAVGRISGAFARRFGTPSQQPDIVTDDAIAGELGEWARGYALDQRLSGAKARAALGWAPRHLDPAADITGSP
jgi:nucleoside-diphosphate-sugar epimerase